MNQVYCPECETELTKSIVGYLCHGCGSAHGFEKVSSTDFPNSGTSVAINDPIESSFAPDQPALHDDKTTSVEHSMMRHHVNKLLVPQIAELPAPINEEHLLSAPVTNDNTISTDEIQAYEPPAASEAMKEEFSADVASHALQEANSDVPDEVAEHNHSHVLPIVAIVSIIVAIGVILAYFFIPR